MRRKYVIVKRRDGRLREPTFDSVEIKTCMDQGRKAAQMGEQRMYNPYQAIRARAWTFAWEQEHLNQVGTRCPGCELCETGTRFYGESFKEWMQRGSRRWSLDSIFGRRASG